MGHREDEPLRGQAAREGVVVRPAEGRAELGSERGFHVASSAARAAFAGEPFGSISENHASTAAMTSRCEAVSVENERVEPPEGRFAFRPGQLDEERIESGRPQPLLHDRAQIHGQQLHELTRGEEPERVMSEREVRVVYLLPRLPIDGSCDLTRIEIRATPRCEGCRSVDALRREGNMRLL
jgi:hypothetical protein